MKWPALLTMLLLLLPFPDNAPAQQNVTRDDRELIVAEICDILRDYYVYPDIAETIIDTLETGLHGGKYDSALDNESLAELVTADLRSVNQDLHLRVDALNPRERRTEDEPNWPRIFLSNMLNAKSTNYGVVSVKVYDGNIGYLEMTKLKPLNSELRRIMAGVMEFLSNVDALIVDLRRNTGGTPEMIEFLTSYFFDGQVPLTGQYSRDTGGIRTSETLANFDNRKLVDVPLYLLTANRTISAPEGFAYNLQALERATVIGEVTRGAANPGRFFRIREKVQLLVATGYAENPLTKSNWEGVGIIPDIETPAAEALDRALEVASEAAAAFRRSKETVVAGYIERLNRQISEVEELVDKDPVAGERMLNTVVDEWLDKEFLNRYFFLELGDQYRKQGNIAMAILVFKQTPRFYPDYTTGHRLLADAYLSEGDTTNAMKHLTKILEIDPNDEVTLQKIVSCRGGS